MAIWIDASIGAPVTFIPGVFRTPKLKLMLNTCYNFE